MVRTQSTSPLEKMRNVATGCPTPIIDLAQACCNPIAEQRPDFASVASMLGTADVQKEILPEGTTDARPDQRLRRTARPQTSHCQATGRTFIDSAAERPKTGAELPDAIQPNAARNHLAFFLPGGAATANPCATHGGAAAKGGEKTFRPGVAVRVRRSGGGESAATVVASDAANKAYRVRLADGHEKDCRARDMRLDMRPVACAGAWQTTYDV